MTRARRRRRPPKAPPDERSAPLHALDATPRTVPLALIVVLGVVTLWALGARGGWIYDDLVLIVDQRRPRSLDALAALLSRTHWNGLPYYRPLSQLTLGAARWALGDDPSALKIVNALFMGALSLCSYLLFRAPSLGLSRSAAALAAALVGAHPAASECVYIASAGAESLGYLVCVVGAAAAWIRDTPRDRAIASGLCALALLFKEQAVVTPALFLAIDLTRASGGASPRTLRGWVTRYAPTLALLALWFALRAQRLDAAEPLRLGFVSRPERVPLSFVYTARALVTPTPGLSYEPDYTVARALPWGLVPVGLFAALTHLGLRANPRVAKLGVAWALLAVLPTANLAAQETHFADRYTLLALPGVALVVAAACADGARQRLLTLGVAACALMVTMRAGDFRDNDTFLRRWAAVEPSPYRALAALGEDARRAGRDRDAVAHWSRAVLIEPVRARYLHRHLGMAHERLGAPDEAMRAYRIAVRADRRDAYSRARLESLLSASRGP